jgi:hypothetical protein
MYPMTRPFLTYPMYRLSRLYLKNLTCRLTHLNPMFHLTHLFRLTHLSLMTLKYLTCHLILKCH